MSESVVSKHVVVVGSVNVDHVLKVPSLPRPGETVTGQGYQVLGGGKGANQAVAAARLGADVRFVADVGDDAAGAALLRDFEADGLGLGLIRRVPDRPTGCAMIFVDEGGENCIGIDAGANAALDPARIDACEAIFDGADSLLIQLETPLPSVQRALELARGQGVRTVLNPAPAQPLPVSVLSQVDVITPNETEAEVLTGVPVSDEASAVNAAKALHELGIGCVIITLGGAGALVSQQQSSNHRHEVLAPPRVHVVDTTAAGDTFNGALVAALARGDELLAAVGFANAAAALSVTRFGAQPSIPRLSEIA